MCNFHTSFLLSLFPIYQLFFKAVADIYIVTIASVRLYTPIEIIVESLTSKAIEECVKEFGKQSNSDGETLRPVHSLLERAVLVKANVKLDELVHRILSQNSLTPHAVDWSIFTNAKYPTSDEELVRVHMWLKLHFPSIFPAPAVSGMSFPKASKKGKHLFSRFVYLAQFFFDI